MADTNLTRTIEKYFRPVLLVLAFLGLLMFAFAKEARGEVTTELGAGFLSGEVSKGAALILTERWGGPYDNRYSVGMGYISEQEVTDRSGDFYEVRENLWVQAQRRVPFPVKGCPIDCWGLGIGVAYFNGTNRALGSNLTAALSVEFRPNERLSVNIRHYSNAGSATPNMGQDMLSVGYTF